jgi:MoaA/NifB/PqqE/SkfB family radical SAM enzyme
MPVLALMPHSRCNCRCLMCDIWRANKNMKELSPALINQHVEELRQLGVRWILLTGGEALMHSDLWKVCAALQPLNARITLLSTGLLLPRALEGIKTWIDEVIVSLDGNPEVHNKIRNIPRAYERLETGVRALRKYAPQVGVSARCVLQKQNFRDFGAIVATAKDLELGSISFLAADVSNTAFNRQAGWNESRVLDVSLSAAECDDLETVLTQSFDTHAADYASGFIVESPQKILQIVAHYRAHNGSSAPTTRRCNAPWVSGVIEPDGGVRPCYFHPEIGNINDGSFADILNSPHAIEFRRQLDVNRDPVCASCTCTLNV